VAIGKKTRLRNHDVQQVLEMLLEVWTDELAAGGRIEIQNFLVLEVQTIHRRGNRGVLVHPNGHAVRIPAVQKRVRVSASKYLRSRIREKHR
jgi:nucleoid DNA-binding protein